MDEMMNTLKEAVKEHEKTWDKLHGARDILMKWLDDLKETNQNEIVLLQIDEIESKLSWCSDSNDVKSIESKIRVLEALL